MALVREMQPGATWRGWVCVVGWGHSDGANRDKRADKGREVSSLPPAVALPFSSSHHGSQDCWAVAVHFRASSYGDPRRCATGRSPPGPFVDSNHHSTLHDYHDCGDTWGQLAIRVYTTPRIHALPDARATASDRTCACCPSIVFIVSDTRSNRRNSWVRLGIRRIPAARMLLLVDTEAPPRSKV